ncbi:MAG: fido (protein-threonine AMPylation protein) [Halioglobus sp.]|jgi:fido (protein-threonine AMPylation protein)
MNWNKQIFSKGSSGFNLADAEEFLAIHSFEDCIHSFLVKYGREPATTDVPKKIGVDHIQIHPFTNGNGRHARIASDALLKDYFNHSPIDWATGGNLELSSTRRDAYISTSRAADAQDFN